VTLNDALDNGQADAGAFEFIAAVQALKDTEQLVGILHVEAGAVVAHKYDGLRVASRLTADPYLRLRALASELQGIRDQIDQHYSQHGVIADNDRQLRDAPFDGSARCFRFEFTDDLLNQRPKVDKRISHLPTPHPRKGEDVVDQRAHAPGRVGYGAHVVPTFFIEVCLGSLFEQADKSVDVAQRRAQVVRDGVGKGFEFPVRQLQLSGALDNALFEFLIELANLFFGVLAVGDIKNRPDQAADGPLTVGEDRFVEDDIAQFAMGVLYPGLVLLHSSALEQLGILGVIDFRKLPRTDVERSLSYQLINGCAEICLVSLVESHVSTIPVLIENRNRHRIEQ